MKTLSINQEPRNSGRGMDCCASVPAFLSSKFTVLCLGILGLCASARAALPFEDGFETYAVGQNFAVLTNGWQAGGTVVVTNDPGHRRGTQSAQFVDVARLTNAVAAGSGLKVWTEAWVEPYRGGPPLDGITNGAIHALYFSTNGYAMVATAAGWTACSNDVWGGTVAPDISARFVHVAVYDDYAHSNWACFVDGRLVLQDQAFTPPPGGCQSLELRNADGNAWLDDVWVKTSHNAAVLTNSYNHIALADAAEVALYGYAARTLHVGTGPGVPHFASLAAALAAWRPNDLMHVYGGTYAESVVVTQDVAFVGGSFTNSGTLTVAAGADVTFAQSATWGAAAVTGTLAMASGTALTVQSGLTVGSGGSLAIVNGTLVATAEALTLTGTFTIDSTWGTQATLPLPLADTFDLYTANTRLKDLGYRGWGASSTGAVVLAGQGVGASQGAGVSAGTMVSNRVDRGAASRIWTDAYLRLQPGITPINVSTGDATFACFLDTNRNLVVSTPTGWVVCSNDVSGAAVPAVDTQVLSRVTVHVDLVTHCFALFLDGRLLRESLAFPGGAVTSYRSLIVDNRAEATVHADEILITTNLPFASGYPPTGADLDGDDWSDAYEIHLHGNLSTLKNRNTVFRFR